MKTFFIGLTGLIIFLAVPFALNREKDSFTVGPQLSDLSYQEISFSNGELNLAGMVFLPQNQGPHPLAVFIHGSGTSRRNNVWYLSMVRHLVENGIAVLMPDKRGSEKSGGDWKGVSLQELATDTIAAIDYIKNQNDFVIGQIGVVGVSQGGWIASVVASQNEDVSFVVSVSGSGTTTDRQLEYEEINSIQQMGTYRFMAKMIASFTIPNIKQRFFWKGLADFDPIPYWRDVKTPVFFAFGENDANVPVDESIERLRNLKNQNFSYQVYPDGGHGITQVVSASSREIQPRFLKDFAEFIKSCASE